VIAAAAVLLLSRLPAKKTGSPSRPWAAGASSQNAAGGMSAGIMMGEYYQYKDSYYKLEYQEQSGSGSESVDFRNIQSKITRSLGGMLYQISGYDPAKCIAVFNDFYYYKADFVFKTSVTLGGRSYVLSPGELPNAGSYDSSTHRLVFNLGESLGQAGPFEAFAIPGVDPGWKVAVELDKKTGLYGVAYNMPPSVSFNGTEYYLGQWAVEPFRSSGQKPIGKAGGYEIYQYSTTDAQMISVKLGTSQALAVAFTPSNKAPPTSWYGSPQESMYPVDADMIFNNNDYRMTSSDPYLNGQKGFDKMIGAKLGDVTINGYAYGIYALSGTSPSDAVAVKNNLEYVKYDFNFNCDVKYNGEDYIITLPDQFTGKVGGSIGKTADGNQVDSVVGVDPQKEIIVVIGGGTWNALRK